ncbi:hypothetical protein B0O99DRAFT_604336 [Bisporella sp. PMI_857]|nr:hypothetical protein B0O99DRAFT_604336 [Bisporella sp. PMI_857]
MLYSPQKSVLGRDPERTHRINANSFQQNAITSFGEWQYATFYTDALDANQSGVCHVNITRRRISQVSNTVNNWETLTFKDYNQTMDDGHNTISIAVCRGDGTVHIAYDHHCDDLRFRISEQGIALKSGIGSWSTCNFTTTQGSLPGIASNDFMKEVTYPRFANIGDDLLLTYRIGQAGLGSDVLYRYSASNHVYTYLGQHLTGISNSPYINGIDYSLGRLHISWCYRNFVQTDADTPANAHKQQAGPNGPENNHDLNYAFSDDLGETWKNSDGATLAVLANQDVNTIRPGAYGIRVFEIPMGSGILNQEAQAADWEGGFWVLNRENRSGSQRWVVYHRDPKGSWTSVQVNSTSQPTEIGSRGSICADRRNQVFLVLPGNMETSLSIMRAKILGGSIEFEEVWRDKGFDGEPLVDIQRLEFSDVLSVYTRTASSGSEDAKKNVVVIDFALPIVGEENVLLREL